MQGPRNNRYDLFTDLSQRFAMPLQKLKTIVEVEVPKFNAAAAKYQSQAVDVSKGLK